MKTEPTNVRVTPETLAKIKLAADLSGKTSADIMRLAIDLGLRRLEAVDYAIDKMVLSGIETAESGARPPAESSPRPLRTTRRTVSANTVSGDRG